jgi:radical SAM PhpK family P-methyltransferase
MSQLDCVIIGYNEIPFQRYVELLGHYSEDSEAYRDLKFSFVDFEGESLNYVDLLNRVIHQDHHGAAQPMFRSGEIPNLASMYLSNFLRKQGLTTGCINLFQEEKDKFKSLLQQDALCVAITTTFYVLNFPANEIVQFVRENQSKAKIVVGGPLIANHTRNLKENELRDALADIGADFYVVDAQGELTLAALVANLKDGGDGSDVPNLIFFRDGQMVHTPVIPESNSMDEVDIDWRSMAQEQPLGQTLQMRTARSCAFKCSFCNYPTRAGKLSLAGIDTVERELESIRALGNVRNVVFIDDTFNVPLPRFKELCRMMAEKNFGFNWFSYFRCSNSDDEAIRLMAESGCKGVFLGIESGSPTILKNMNKAATVERYAEGIKMLREYGISTFGSFILGFPGETRATVEETVTFIQENKPDFYRVQMWYCEPGTPIMMEREKYQISGEGFVWKHATMTSLEAMDHIDRIFLQITESLWLPQWSFDFWFIPYFTGKGLSIENFKEFVSRSYKLLAMDIAYVPAVEKQELQRKYLGEMNEMVKSWPLVHR